VCAAAGSRGRPAGGACCTLAAGEGGQLRGGLAETRERERAALRPKASGSRSQKGGGAVSCRDTWLLISLENLKETSRFVSQAGKGVLRYPKLEGLACTVCCQCAGDQAALWREIRQSSDVLRGRSVWNA